MHHLQQQVPLKMFQEECVAGSTRMLTGLGLMDSSQTYIVIWFDCHAPKQLVQWHNVGN
jgi:hypothetical protein